jgi:hypothetical protein
MYEAFIAHMKQPTSIAGLNAIIGAIMGYVSGSLSLSATISIAAPGLLAIIMPDNSAAKTAITQVITDLPPVVSAFEKPKVVTTVTTESKV